ncbi:MAG: branched-chain amino acid ABC transporter permease, partial [Rhizobacter sp.]|nr:branched-chain amino acid ABC transporter permease [Rhizobacter sp.]
MNVLLHQVLSGLATGGIYASVALALVMIYQATHLVNFAQGELAMFSTYIAWSLMQAGMPYWAAFFITVAIAFVLGVLIERVIVQPVENAPILSVVIVFIGLLVILNSVAGWIFSYTIKPFPSPFPAEPLFGNSYVSSHELGSIGVTLVVLALVFMFFRFTPLGLAMRAAAQNPVSSRLVGIRVGWMLALGWGLASAIGAVAGIMVAPTVFLEPNMMSGILLYAFAAALLGG